MLIQLFADGIRGGSDTAVDKLRGCLLRHVPLVLLFAHLTKNRVKLHPFPHSIKAKQHYDARNEYVNQGREVPRAPVLVLRVLLVSPLSVIVRAFRWQVAKVHELDLIRFRAVDPDE